MTSLIHLQEVLKYNISTSRGFPVDAIDRAKGVIERTFFRNCLGIDFYEAMKLTVVDWSTIQEWNKNTIYSIGNKVFYGGLAKESLENNNQNFEPTVSSAKWKEATKFTTAEYDKIWKDYLREIIANEIILHTLTIASLPADASGVNAYIENQESSKRGSTPSERAELCRQIRNINDMQIAEFKEYIILTHKAKTFDYSKVLWIKEDCEKCVTNSFKRRHFLLYND